MGKKKQTLPFLHSYYPGHWYIEEIINKASLCDNIVLDCFAGRGGVTDGFSRVPNFYVIACINHWYTAIMQHLTNHPDCLHLMEDFRTADLTLIKYIIDEVRKRNPNVNVHGWFSLECTNFSMAKGGMSRDADSRTLADHVDRYVTTLDLDVIWIENVKEFRWWGPMIPKIVHVVNGKNKKVYIPDDMPATDYIMDLANEGTYLSCPLIINKNKSKKKKDWELGSWNIPDPKKKGKDFRRWVRHIKSLGYDSYERLINMADYGVPQHRIRLIMQFPRKGVAPSYPMPTHDRYGRHGLQPWIPIKTCLDLQDEGQSVLLYNKNKKGQMIPRIKSKKTIERLIKGCIRHPLRELQKQFISQANNGFMSNDQNFSLDNSARTLNCTGGNMQVVTVQNIEQYYGAYSGKSLNDPAPMIPTKDRAYLVTKKHIDQQYGGSDNNHKSIHDASGSIMINPKQNVVTTTFIEHRYSSGQTDKSINEAAGAILENPKQNLIHVQHVMDTQFDHVGHSIDDIAKTITANRKHYYIVTTSFNNPAKSIDEVSSTVIARMDKKPPYLVVTEFGQLAIEVYDYDPPHLVELKKFMAENGIISISMRPLSRKELKRIQTLEADSEDIGTETDQKKMIGNAVPSLFVELLAKSYDDGRKLSSQKVA